MTHPLIRRNGALVQATWEEALEFVAEQTNPVQSRPWPQSLRRTDFRPLYQRRISICSRSSCGSPSAPTNLDSSARYGHVNGVQAMRRVQGTHRWTVTFEDIAASGRAASGRHQHHRTNPITGLKSKKPSRKRDATLITHRDDRAGDRHDQQHFQPVAATFLCPAVPVSAVYSGSAEGRGRETYPVDSHTTVAGLCSAVSQAFQQLSWDGLEPSPEQPPHPSETRSTLAGGRRVVVLAGQVLLRSKRLHRFSRFPRLCCSWGNWTSPGAALLPWLKKTTIKERSKWEQSRNFCRAH